MRKILLVSFLFYNALSWAATRQDVPITHVFVPPVRSVVRDPVEVVIVGELPNPCFTLDPTGVERLSANEFRISQTAWLRTDGACEAGRSEDDPTAFHVVVKLGILPEGSYQIRFDKEEELVRSFQIAAASPALKESGPVALIQGVGMDDLFMPGAKVQANLIGSTAFTCDVGVKPQTQVVEDVVVVLPIESVEAGSRCQPQARPFHQELDLVGLAPGWYLLDVRSRDGKSHYRPFQVLKPWTAGAPR